MDRRTMVDYKVIVKMFFTVVILTAAVCGMYYLGYNDGWEAGGARSFSVTVQSDGKVVEKVEKKKETAKPKRKKKYPAPQTVIRRHFSS